MRPWKIEDAHALYKYASNPKVLPNASWPVHTSVEFSRQVIKDVFFAEGIYAIVPKGEEEPIGCICLLIGEASDFGIGHDEGEIAYWMVLLTGGKDLYQK